MNLSFYLRRLPFLILFKIIICCNSWSPETETTLSLAEQNRKELEKVLQHYKEIEIDSLKLEAAKYLIQNMRYQYSLRGSSIDSLNKNFKDVYGVYYKNRNSVFRSDSLKINNNRNATYDIHTLSANQIIEQIESAFKIYEKFEWCGKYPFDIFCEYILPYKINNYHPVLWRDYATDKYIDFLNHLSISDRKKILEAERDVNSKNLKVKIEGLSNGFGYNITPNSQNLSFNFEIEKDKVKLFEIYYLNKHRTGANVQVLIDGNFIKNLFLPASGDLKGIDEDIPQVNFTAKLSKGEHKLELIAIEKDVIVDCIIIPEFKEMNIPQGFISPGIYTFKSSIGEIAVKNDSLVDEHHIKLSKNSIHKSLIKVIPKDGNLYQLVFKTNSEENKAIDAFPFGSMTKVLVYKDHGYQNQQWFIIPYKNKGYEIRNKETGKILAFSEKDSILIQLPSEDMSDKYVWHLSKIENEPKSLDLSVRVAQKISDITDQFHWSGPGPSFGPINPINLLDYPFGTCVEETNFQTMVLRSLGIACSVDFIFNYPERIAGHSWSVIFDYNGNTIQNNCHNPVGSGTWVDAYSKGKVYRKTNTINKKSIFIKNNGEEIIPIQLQTPYIKDVTNEYCKAQDVKIEIAKKKMNKYGYLLVFDNQKWVLTGWGEKSLDSIVFKDIEPGAMFLPATYEKGNFEAFNAPFYIDSIGNKHHFKISDSLKQDIIIKRKFPNRLVTESLHSRIIGGKFQGANKSDFSDAITIGTISNKMLEPVFHRIDVNEKKSFKYLRYLGPENGYCNISEFAFFDKENKKVIGEIMGTMESSENSTQSKEKAFDNDVLTYYNSTDSSGDWIGLELNKPTSISKIRFVARNDGNMVEIGDDYELVYWDDDWISAGKQIATNDSLIFQGVPKNTLYILHNNTKGSEERIFTYKNGKQIWW